MRCLIYARQSDSDGEGDRSLSMDSQVAVLRADADRLGWSVVGELRDADLKGYDDQRPGLLAIYERCRAGEVDVVAFWSLSRLARSVRITETVVHELDRLGVALHSHEEPWVATPMMRQVFAAFAEQQTRDISAHVRRAMRERQQRGLWQGAVPFGYRRPTADAPLVIHPGEAAIVAAVFARAAAGEALPHIAAALARQGVPTVRGGQWSTQHIRLMLRRVVYRGAVPVGDGCIEGAHPAIVSDDLWRQAQRGVGRGPRTKPAPSWLEGHIRHACGRPMYLQRITSHGEARQVFRCRAGSSGALAADAPACPYLPRQIDRARAETLAWEVMRAALDALPRSPAPVISEARRAYRAAAPTADARRADLAARRERACARRQRAEDLYLSGARDRVWFAGEDARAVAELAALDAELAALPALPDECAIEALWASLRQLRDITEVVQPAERGGVLRALGTVMVSPSPARQHRHDGSTITLHPRPELRALLARAR